jgi:hypothetical protein
MALRTHPLHVWLLAALHWIAAVAPAQGLVLCTGPDGHVALEAPSVEGDCSGCVDEPGRPESAPAASTPVPPIGCPCIDVPLLSGMEREEARLPTRIGPELVAQVPPTLVAELPCAARLVAAGRVRARGRPPSAAVRRRFVLLV